MNDCSLSNLKAKQKTSTKYQFLLFLTIVMTDRPGEFLGQSSFHFETDLLPPPTHSSYFIQNSLIIHNFEAVFSFFARPHELPFQIQGLMEDCFLFGFTNQSCSPVTDW